MTASSSDTSLATSLSQRDHFPRLVESAFQALSDHEVRESSLATDHPLLDPFSPLHHQ
jgi:hypothetical protein